MRIIRGLVQKAAWATDVMSDALGWLATVTLVVLCLFLFVGTALRYALNIPYRHLDELASYVVIAVVFLGLAYTLKVGGHIRSTVLSQVVGPSVWRVLQIIMAILGLIWAWSFFLGCLSFWMVLFTKHVVGYGLLHIGHSFE